MTSRLGLLIAVSTVLCVIGCSSTHDSVLRASTTTTDLPTKSGQSPNSALTPPTSSTSSPPTSTSWLADFQALASACDARLGSSGQRECSSDPSNADVFLVDPAFSGEINSLCNRLAVDPTAAGDAALTRGNIGLYVSKTSPGLDCTFGNPPRLVITVSSGNSYADPPTCASLNSSQDDPNRMCRPNTHGYFVAYVINTPIADLLSADILIRVSDGSVAGSNVSKIDKSEYSALATDAANAARAVGIPPADIAAFAVS